MSDCTAHSNSNVTTVNNHEGLDILATTIVAAQALQDTLQLIYDTTGFFQGRRSGDDKLFQSQNPFRGTTGDYDSALDLKSEHVFTHFDDDGNLVTRVTKVNKDGEEIAGGEKKASVDPLDDEDKNPCVEHPYLHKTMMQGGGLEVEIIQEPDPRYVECYDRQLERQKREELRELCRFDLLYGSIPDSSVQGRSGKRICGKWEWIS